MKDFKCGDEVLGKIQKIGGTYAQYAVFRPNELVKKPESLTFEEAACIPVCGLTVYQALKKHLNSKSNNNQKILVLGGSGGTGINNHSICNKSQDILQCNLPDYMDILCIQHAQARIFPS